MWEVRDDEGVLKMLPTHNRNVAYRFYDENDGYSKGWTVKPRVFEIEEVD